MKKAPLTDRQTRVSPCPPLSLYCLQVLDVSKRQESEEREDREQRLGALFGPLASELVKVQGEEKEG